MQALRVRTCCLGVLCALAACGPAAKRTATTLNQDAAGGEPPISSDAQGVPGLLPASLKGYELYAWNAGSTLEFTLMTGTNRAKTPDEILARAPGVEDDAWVALRGQGLAALQQVLGRVPEGTDVVLAELSGLPGLTDQGRAEVQAALASR